MKKTKAKESEKSKDSKKSSSKHKKLPKGNSIRFEDIIDLQQVNGSWLWEKIVDLIPGLTDEMKETELTQDLTLWATIVVINYLEKNYKSDKDLWELSVKKSIGFTKKQCKADNISFEDLSNAAKALVDTL